MRRRGFLKIMSAASLLALGGLNEITSVKKGAFRSKVLQFSFQFPLHWEISTIKDQVRECGWRMEDQELPVAVVSKFREPTPKPNPMISFLALDTDDYRMEREDFEIMTQEVFDSVSNIPEYLGDWKAVDATSDSKYPAFKYSFKALSDCLTTTYIATAYLFYDREHPLYLMVQQPVGEKEIDLISIIHSLRLHA